MSRGFPSMTALLGLLAVAGYQNRDKIAEMLKNLTGGNPSDHPAGQHPAGQSALPGGLGNILGGAAGSAGVGGLLGGGLSELVDRFTQNGHGEAANSWVGSGANREMTAQDMHQAIGPDVLATLEQQTGLSRDELLSRLSRALPEAVNQYTPDGRLPAV
jgi:uncharacterized protein YidB (DUF937 family)